jgi:CheY-like chemotaxis protein
MLGGRLFKHSVVGVGSATVEAIRQVRADLYFMGVCSVHPEAGLSTGDFEEACVKRALSAAAAETIVLASPEKLATASPYQVIPLDELSRDWSRWPACPKNCWRQRPDRHAGTHRRAVGGKLAIAGRARARAGAAPAGRGGGMIRVLIAEDQALVLGALAALLRLEGDLDVVGCARNGREALALCVTLAPDIVLTDIEMPLMTGLELAAALAAQKLACKVIIVTTFARSRLFAARAGRRRARILAQGCAGRCAGDGDPQRACGRARGGAGAGAGRLARAAPIR